MHGNKVLPSDIALPERTLLANGAMFVRLPTLDQLEHFWNEHRSSFAYAAQGLAWGHSRNSFLQAEEWVFGPTKASVVSTACRWEEMGFRCQWYDWAADDPESHSQWFIERTEYRNSRVASGDWSSGNEELYQLDLKARTPETYRGWWELRNLPGGMEDAAWFGLSRIEVCDPHLSTGEATRLMQEKTYDDWDAAGADEIEFTDAEGVDSIIAYWLSERSNGEDYYGSENEAELPH
ncbi:hypothetical protein ACCD10_25370 [Pseudomonas sp. Pseusp122]|uniref:hypothetical protein n=1 Tax=unclassified Pseudomonas TaxID=196821 RepID=UPI0039A765A5